jgi:hypothetical protein
MPFSDMATAGLPAPDQIEVSVFGPNYGECIVLHLGNGHWIVVDSCLQDGEPVAIAYLRALGIQPAKSIKAVVATHWHDDHVKGLSQILAAAPQAIVWVAAPLTTEEFLRFSARFSTNRTAVAGTKLTEFSKILDEIGRRNQAGLVNFGFANANSSIYRLDPASSGHGHFCEISALSPSHGDQVNFLERVAANMPQARQTKRAIPSPSPNDVSIAALVKVGPLSILLGADLENSTRANAGWEAVLAAHRAQPFGPRASVYKNAHHGSATAHNPDIWEHLLVDVPFAVLTPWRKGRTRIPTLQGVRDILKLSNNAFTTASDARSRSTRGDRPPGVLRLLREPQIRVRSLTAPFGAVRFRTTNITSARWSSELFGAASHLTTLIKAQSVR